MNQTSRTRAVARRLASVLDGQQREDVRAWAERLLALRSSDLRRSQRAREAIRATVSSGQVMTVAIAISRGLREHLWTKRRWATRLGLGVGAVAAVSFGSQGAGIAALGGAIAVPLWVVFGAGGSFAGVLIDELTARRDGVETSTNGALVNNDVVPEADWTFNDDAEEEIVRALLTPSSNQAAPDAINDSA